MTETLGAFGNRVWLAFIERAEAGTWPVERVVMESRAFVRDTMGRRCYWLARGGYVETSMVSAQVWEPPRDELGFDVYDLVAFADEDRLVDLAGSILWRAYELRIEALAAAARVHGVEAGPANARVFFFGGLLSKEWEESEDDDPARWARRYVSGRLELAALVKGRTLGEETGPVGIDAAGQRVQVLN